ncbi:hypothetical protein K0U91_12485 [Chryseobacterium chendengshani]|uniref:hypothetical protein n=1 Tax=Chryseobacterium sp. LJ668 TaxID=2864040 RepID=UPI001C69267F|nr:hypothetical protein [Chryseobacterium sp. LJ668]MBW8523587.1 hypothetical protein [Chryseobacterium sp. LJ668]QYK15870.1 hypothetical protein K0U91_12485 [Chryseobacterium sp. LJ668]
MRIYFFFTLYVFPVIAFSQDLKPNNKIKSDSDFTHTVSGVTAPYSLNDFSRTTLFTNSKNDSVFAAEYENKRNDAVFKFKIIPALLHEERLLNHYYKDLNERRYTPKESEKVNKTVVFKEGKFKLHGISTYFTHLNRLVNVRVYDAGFWVLISESSQKGNDTLSLDKAQDLFLTKIKPTKIVEKNPLTRYSNILYAPVAAQDKLLLRTTMSSATNKMKWIYENIDKYERAAGIPGILLDFQIAGINGFIDYKTEKNQSTIEGNNPATRLISFFTKLKKDGFIDEYLMEQYYYLLTPSENQKFDYKGYQKWKLENSIDYNVAQKYYIIVNSRKKTDLNKDE